MPTQAEILVNGNPGSNDDVPINVLVQLDNDSLGGEVSYAWTILDQPPGAADALSATNVKNPTFVPKKEGTYLIRLDVNNALPDEAIDQVVVAVRDLKTRERVPAAGETAEDDTSVGWSTSVDGILRRTLGMAADSSIVVATAGEGMAAGQVVRFSSAGTIKTGLPGQEYLSVATKALANDATKINGVVGVFLGTVTGNANALANDLIRVRLFGLVGPLNGNFAAATPLYVDDTGALSANPGTIARRIGITLLSINGNTQYFALLDGMGMFAARAVTDLTVDPTGGLHIAGAFDATGAGTTFTGPLTDAELQGNSRVLSAAIDFLAGGIQKILKTGGALQIGTGDVNELDVIINNTVMWSFLTTGAFAAQGASRAIQNVLNPVNPQDAATKAYVDTGDGALAPTFVQFGAETMPANSTVFLFPGYSTSAADGNERQTRPPMTNGFSLHDLFIQSSANGIGTTGYTATVRKNGVDTAISGVFPAGGGFQGLGPVAFAQGDRVSIKVVTGNAPTPKWIVATSKLTSSG